MMILDVEVKTSMGEGETEFNLGLGVGVEGLPNWLKSGDGIYVEKGGSHHSIRKLKNVILSLT